MWTEDKNMMSKWTFIVTAVRTEFWRAAIKGNALAGNGNSKKYENVTVKIVTQVYNATKWWK